MARAGTVERGERLAGPGRGGLAFGDSPLAECPAIARARAELKIPEMLVSCVLWGRSPLQRKKREKSNVCRKFSVRVRVSLIFFSSGKSICASSYALESVRWQVCNGKTLKEEKTQAHRGVYLALSFR